MSEKSEKKVTFIEGAELIESPDDVKLVKAILDSANTSPTPDDSPIDTLANDTVYPQNRRDIEFSPLTEVPDTQYIRQSSHGYTSYTNYAILSLLFMFFGSELIDPYLSTYVSDKRVILAIKALMLVLTYFLCSKILLKA